PDETYLATAWHLSWMRGVLLATICWFSAPALAGFFSSPGLIDLLRLAAFIPLIQGLESLGVLLLKRDLSFKRILVIDLSRETIQTIVAITTAWLLGWGAIALVAGLLVGQVAALLSSYLVHEYRPHLYFSKNSAQELWSYGSHLLGAGVLIYAMTNLDDAVIGRMLGTEALGYYAIAFALAGYLTTQMVKLSNQVMFPAYSGIQEDTARIGRVMQQHAHLTLAILTPLAIGAALLPEAVVQLAVGNQWLPVVPVFVVLLLMGWLRGCATVFGPVLMARGRTRAIHKMKWIEFLFFSAAIVPFVHFFGVIGAAWVLTAVYGISLTIHLRLVRDELKISLKPVFAALFAGASPALAAGFFAYIFIWTFSGALVHWGWATGLVFVAFWSGAVLARDRKFLRDLWSMATG
ncbi:MAG: oligosaccharide flippase family protein, partial [Mariprofundaceae bacterium]|nr:oligosaccharide flippase family protein [Mariprofundaceae bacterium]